MSRVLSVDEAKKILKEAFRPLGCETGPGARFQIRIRTQTGDPILSLRYMGPVIDTKCLKGTIRDLRSILARDHHTLDPWEFPASIVQG